jgi:hypothetical protein
MDEDRDKIEYPNQMLKKEDHSDKNLHLTHPFHANSNIFHISSEIFLNSLHHLKISTKAQQKERKMMRDEYKEVK